MSLRLAMMILRLIGCQDQHLQQMHGLGSHLRRLTIGKQKMKSGKLDQKSGGSL